ncbi:unnamed protein product [Fraxinus pennsylvanica]|uniref:Uncharacterized protein n=1 Tax=Fraxinus pennsylvanica TaxID=56036 RepID=A0AAD1ZLH4_9LAMI|nr:unnamed protein product [Fraxinus pennsylvanica]
MSTILKESQHHYGNHFHNRLHSPQPLFPTNHALIPHNNSASRRSSVEGSSLGSIFSAGSKSNITSTRSSGYAFESEPAPLAQHLQSFSGEGIVFRILCLADKGLDDEIFPAQEALLHIQTHIVDLVTGKENIITTWLLLQLDKAGRLQLKDETLPEMRKITGANI